MRVKRILFLTLAGLLPILSGAVCSGSKPTGGDETFVPAGMVRIHSAGAVFTQGQAGFGDPQQEPEHPVAFTYDYWIDRHEVVQADYRALTGVNPSPNIGDSLPVEKVTWYDAAYYCNARSRRDGLDTVYAYESIKGTPGIACTLYNVRSIIARNGYRLPTEAEWEYACRGGTTTEVYWDTTFKSPLTDSCAWHWENSGTGFMVGLTSHTVGTKRPNAFGLYDMAGNISEMCNDRYSEYREDPATDPFGPDTGDMRVMRNGDYGIDRNYLRSAYRNKLLPTVQKTGVGFRVVLRR